MIRIAADLKERRGVSAGRTTSSDANRAVCSPQRGATPIALGAAHSASSERLQCLCLEDGSAAEVAIPNA
jgi:hypothetical protein